jgi:hypothetical protein
MVKPAVYGSATWLMAESDIVNIQNIGQENLKKETAA